MHDEDELLRRIADKLPAMLAYWDADLRCRFANPAYEVWFGVTSESLIGKHISELLGPLYALNLPYIEQALRGERQEFQREIPDPAGGPSRSGLASYIPDIVDGVVRGFIVLVTDITELKRAELARQESEARFAGIVAASADAIVSVDQDQRITIFNDAAARTFGYTRDEILGKPLELLIPELVRERNAYYVGAVVGGPPLSRPMAERATLSARRKSGETFPAEAAIGKLEVGGKAQLTVTLRDITERKQIELERQILAEAGVVFASSLSYQQTLKSIAQLIIQHTADLCVIDMLVGEHTVQRVTVAHADPAKAAVCEQLARLRLDRHHTLSAAALETQKAQLFDDISPAFLEAIAQDAAHLELLRRLAPRSALAVPLVASHGLLGAIVIGSSQPHHYRTRDLGLATELGRRASLAIENALLYEAEQRATRARDEALAIVAHDVRSPLNSILLGARMLEHHLSGERDPACANSLRIILHSVDRANHLIEDLLDISRIDAQALAVSRDRVAVRPLLEYAMSSQQVLAAAAAVDLQLEPGGALPDICGDQYRLLQVLDNLIGNAIKFTPSDGRITVRASARPGEVVFSVADSGPGIAAEHLARIFDRFWQVSRAERRGAGLGLPICKGIVEAHGGRIWVESTIGCGTTFFFTIPTAPQPAAHPERAPLTGD